MASCDTRYFGTTGYEEDSVILFPRGPLGFEQETRFLLIQRPDQFPLVYLQSVMTPGLCFLALPVLAVDSGYTLRLTEEDSGLLRVPHQPEPGHDVLCLALVTVQPEGATANLLAPLVINLQSRAGLQCIHADGNWSHRHRLAAPEKEAAA